MQSSVNNKEAEAQKDTNLSVAFGSCQEYWPHILPSLDCFPFPAPSRKFDKLKSHVMHGNKKSTGKLNVANCGGFACLTSHISDIC